MKSLNNTNKILNNTKAIVFALILSVFAILPVTLSLFNDIDNHFNYKIVSAVGGGGGGGDGGGDGDGDGDGGGSDGPDGGGGPGGGGGGGDGCCEGGGSDGPDPSPSPSPAPAPAPAPSPSSGGSFGGDGDGDAQPRRTPRPVCTFDSSPSTVESGEYTTLSWSTSNATRVDINQGVGSRLPLDGSLSVRMGSQTEVFTLTASGPGGTVSCVEVVRVVDTPPPSSNPVRCTLDADPRVIDRGESTTLIWTTRNADEVFINRGIGTVLPNDFLDVSPTFDTTYILTAIGEDGDDVDCRVTVLVEDDGPTDDREPICIDFDARDRVIDEGDTTRLEWVTRDGDELEIRDDRGRLIFDTFNTSEVEDGSFTVRPREDTDYTLTVFNDEGEDECDTTVRVDEDVDDDDDDRDRDRLPRCDFYASDYTIRSGERVTLTWDNRDGDELEIEDDRGRRIYRTDDRRDVEDGSIRVEPTRDTEYTLILSNREGDDECDLDIRVEDDIDEFTVLEYRDQQPYISLNAVPYTGFDAGFTLKAIFYGLLALWGVIVAYILVIKQDSVLGFTLASVQSKTNSHSNDIKDMFDVARFQSASNATEEYTGVHIDEQTSESVDTDSVPQNLPTGNGFERAQTVIDHASKIVSSDEVVKELEDAAHAHKVLLSSDAIRHFIAVCPHDVDRSTHLEHVLSEARVTYPSEGGWVVLNVERMEELCAKAEGYEYHDDEEPSDTMKDIKADIDSVEIPVGSGSLAEAMITGNITAAYQMIGHRPMVALADAAADLDALYRFKQGDSTAVVSELLKKEALDIPVEHLRNAIDAIGESLDGTYSDEASAVKMAVMKATKALA